MFDVKQYFSKATPGPAVRQGRSEPEILADMLETSFNKGPMQTQSLEEPFLLEKTAQAGRRLDESLLAFIARVGLNPRQLREWTPERISAFVAQIEANSLDYVPEPKFTI